MDELDRPRDGTASSQAARQAERRRSLSSRSTAFGVWPVVLAVLLVLHVGAVLAGQGLLVVPAWLLALAWMWLVLRDLADAGRTGPGLARAQAVTVLVVFVLLGAPVLFVAWAVGMVALYLWGGGTIGLFGDPSLDPTAWWWPEAWWLWSAAMLGIPLALAANWVRRRRCARRRGAVGGVG